MIHNIHTNKSNIALHTLVTCSKSLYPTPSQEWGRGREEGLILLNKLETFLDPEHIRKRDLYKSLFFCPNCLNVHSTREGCLHPAIFSKVCFSRV